MEGIKNKDEMMFLRIVTKKKMMTMMMLMLVGLVMFGGEVLVSPVVLHTDCCLYVCIYLLYAMVSNRQKIEVLEGERCV